MGSNTFISRPLALLLQFQPQHTQTHRHSDTQTLRHTDIYTDTHTHPGVLSASVNDQNPENTGGVRVRMHCGRQRFASRFPFMSESPPVCTEHVPAGGNTAPSIPGVSLLVQQCLSPTAGRGCQWKGSSGAGAGQILSCCRQVPAPKPGEAATPGTVGHLTHGARSCGHRRNHTTTSRAVQLVLALTYC